MDLIQRFLKYVAFDTQSKDDSNTSPSTMKQKLLATYLVKEIQEMGVKEVFTDEFGYVYAFIKGNKPGTPIGFIAHMDTATETSGKDVLPNVIENYDGKDIELGNNVVMKVQDFPNLKKALNHTIITTSGNTLLGADDKAGIAIIVSFIEKLIKASTIPHPDILITFTPDEEVGRGTEHFNFDYYKEKGCSLAYTLDGGDIDTIEYENFNACSATYTIHGKTIHPGSAKNKMVNSALIAMEINSMLPKNMVPSLTEGYEGFFHLIHMEGSCEKTTLSYIVRNHDRNEFNKQKEMLVSIQNYINQVYKEKTVDLVMKDSYYNMKDQIMKNPIVLENAVKGLLRTGITSHFDPIRGGTDGARLSFSGILTPNLGTGGENYHGIYEYLDCDDALKMVDALINIATIYTE